MKGFVTHNPLGRVVARRFVAGETVDDAVKTVREMNKLGIHVSLDHLGENTTNVEDANKATGQALGILDVIKKENLDANISVKLTSMGQDIGYDLCYQNISKVVQKAQDYGDIFVRLDMEGSDYTQKTLDLFRNLWDNGHHNVGVVLQSYLYRTEKDVEDMIKLGVRVRLCKGAYLEPAEVAYQEKAEVDRNYIRCMERLLSEGKYPGLATHDERIIEHAISYTIRNRITADRFEFQMLHGVRRDLQKKLANQGYNVRAYIPYGSEWYPYLMRRMAERPANLFFIASQFWKG
ncbi:MAG: proline dehydrogenase family protein [Chloroflexi bacterium]|nr:proline dehydrogenase family protein [Chloroflexota bacterium]OJV94693.1 MAG: proline dehydrogenase [Chloroflexi bacterium 54-19]